MGDDPLLKEGLFSRMKKRRLKTSFKSLKSPWWDDSCEELSHNLWIPDNYNEDIIDLDSWFSLKGPPKKPLPEIKECPIKESFSVRTLRVILKPTKEEKVKLINMMETQRWFYNFSLSVVRKIDYTYDCRWYRQEVDCNKLYKDVSMWVYQEEITNGKKVKDVSRVKNAVEVRDKRNYIKYPWQVWMMKTSRHNRVVRGAIKSLTGNLNSSFSNQKTSRIGPITLDYKSKKDPQRSCLFTDGSYPKWINEIEGHYTCQKERIPFRYLLKGHTSGFTLTYDKESNKFYAFVPKRISRSNYQTEGTLALDPGIRTFLTGYSPEGHTVEVASGGDSKKIVRMLKATDKLEKRLLRPNVINKAKIRKSRLRLLKRIKNKVDDLHWKTISYLIANYKTIYLPIFNTSQMLQNGDLPKITKRLMSTYSFYKFKTRFKWKASLYNTNLVIGTEHYTSKTCGICGYLNHELGCNKTFSCNYCGLVIDRDHHAARNILIKNVLRR